MADKTELSFDAPIPGMSLTTEPGNRPWESPPRFFDVEDVIEHYIDRIGDESSTNEMMTILEQGIPVHMLVDTLISTGVMEGLHTVEAGLLASPVISEYVQAVADIEGTDYVISSGEKRKGLSRAETSKYKKMIERELEKEYEEEAKSSLFMEEDRQEQETTKSVEPKKPMKGLMARPVAMVAEVAEVDIQPEQEGEEV
jgi:hypothetical protein